MSWNILSTFNTRNNGMGDVELFGYDPSDSLLIWSNNSTANAVNTVKSIMTLVDYYASYNVPKRLYGAGASDQSLSQVMRNLSITKDQCNPLLMWTSGSRIEVPFIQRGRYISPTDLDILIRSRPGRDRRLDGVPIYGSAPAPTTGSTTTTTPASGSAATTPGSGSTTPTPSGSTTPNETVSTGTDTSTTVTPLAPSGGGDTSTSESTPPTLSGNISTTNRLSDDQSRTQSASNDMSAGSKAGISIGVIAAVALLSALGFYIYHKKRSSRVGPSI